MLGLRKHLGTQDMLMQLMEQILVLATRHSLRLILILDLKGAFDSLEHEAIIQTLTDTNYGKRTHSHS